MLAGLWEDEWRRKQTDEEDQRPPVFILVCKNTQIARVLYEWIALDKPPPGIPQSKIEPFKNTASEINTIRVDSKVVAETDTGESKSDFVIRLRKDPERHLILETKGYDELEDLKRAAAQRWIQAVNAEGSYGAWNFVIAKKVSEIPRLISAASPH